MQSKNIHLEKNHIAYPFSLPYSYLRPENRDDHIENIRDDRYLNNEKMSKHLNRRDFDESMSKQENLQSA